MKIRIIPDFIYIPFGWEHKNCGKCGKYFSVRNCFVDNVGRIASPCCKNWINNIAISKAEGI